MVRVPAVFLLDEPLARVDAGTRARLRTDLKRIQQGYEVTTIYVTNDPVEAMALADRIAVIDEGRIAQIGTPMEVYSRPATRFVASFIGSPAMNFLDATLADDGTVHLDGDLRLSPPTSVPAELRGPVLVGIRPEHLVVVDDGPLSMRLDLAEPLGAETLLHGTIAGVDGPITVRVEGEYEAPSGHAIALDVAPERLHLFDPESGTRHG